METGCRSGRTVRRASALLSLLLLAGGSVAAPFTSKGAYREARALSDRADLQAALAKTNAALTRLTGAADEWTWALRILRGEILIKQGNLKEGLPIVTPELPRSIRTSEAEVRRQLALGFAQFPEPARVAPYFERAMRIAAAHQPRLMFDVHLAFGNIPPFEKAESHLETALDLARRRGDALGIANAANALSRLCTREQLYARAVEAGEEANAIYAKLGVAGRLSAASGNLGWAYQELGDFEAAAELFKRAEAAARVAGLESERLTWLNQQGNIELAARRYTGAERYYRQALELARAIDHWDVGSPLANLARVAVESGRFAEAKRYNAESLERRRALEQRDEEQRSLIIDARIAMLTGNAAHAEQTLKRVIAKTEQPATKWEAQALLAQLYARLARNADAEAQFREAVNTVGSARKAIASSELRLAFFNLADTLVDDYVDFLVRHRRVSDALAVTEAIRAQTLEEGLGTAAPVRPIDARTIAKERGATILSYWLARRRSLLWVITPAVVTVYALPADVKIEMEVERYRGYLRGERPSLQLSGAKGEELHRMLVGPALPAIPKGGRVIVIADGSLHALNFETLVAPSPRRYWIEDVIVTNASSLHLLARRESRPASGSLLLVGNPPAPEFPPLPRAGEEIASVARHFRARTILSGAGATPAAYRRAKPGKFDFIHFVAHGVATRRRPLDSAVILARDSASGYRLFARDIVRQPLRARLVTISSCHGAGTRTYAGEGVVGLAWAFLRSGAQQVIAALWEVSDSATPELMDRMYSGIRAGRDPAVALRNAKLTLIRGKGVYRKPMYWAPFVLYSGS